MRKITLALTLAAMLPLASQAQRYFGIATSNWSGTNGVYLNPANLADSRHKFTVDLFSLNMGMESNFSSFSVSGLTDLISNTDAGIGGVLDYKTLDKYSLWGPNAEVRGPGFMASIGRKHGIALTTRARVMIQAHDVDGNLFRSVQDQEFANSFNTGYTAKAGAFNVTGHVWTEIGLSYGGIIWENGKHQVKGGATVRMLRGAGYFSLVNKNLDLQYYAGTDSVTIRNTDLSYGSNISDDFSDVASNLIDGGGKGFGGDVGFVYEYRPKHGNYTYDMDGKTGISDNSKNQYLVRISASITDLGSVKYTTDNKTATFKNNPPTSAGYIIGSELGDNISTYSKLKNYMASHGFSVDSSTGGESKVALPTALLLGIDYHIFKGFYANLMYTQSMVDRTKFGNSFYNQVTVTPRFDVRAFSVGLPITYSTLTSAIRIGAGIRAGGFFVGSDDVVGIGGKYGANVYFGAYVPINKKKPRDSDGDGVSNKKDKCRNEKGVWEMKGCPNPDKDGDGVLDKDDMCPDVAGSKTAKGCPDADMDGVADAEDRCPEAAGPAGMQGCPDRDGDGVADIDDVCPDQPGLAQFKGCPDTDNDGIADNEDKCPNAAGPVANQGCPDSDNDGVPDNADKCPTVAGTVANSGCPEVSVEVKKRLAFAATAIQFETGKATIKKTSNKILDEIVKILNDYPDYNMSIEGHSDNVGNAAKNMQLSKDRANSVKNYFVAKGIATERLSADGFGDTKPVASNKTAAGRAKNRRVAMDLKLKD